MLGTTPFQTSLLLDAKRISPRDWNYVPLQFSIQTFLWLELSSDKIVLVSGCKMYFLLQLRKRVSKKGKPRASLKSQKDYFLRYLSPANLSSTERLVLEQ